MFEYLGGFFMSSLKTEKQPDTLGSFSSAEVQRFPVGWYLILGYSLLSSISPILGATFYSNLNVRGNHGPQQ